MAAAQRWAAEGMLGFSLSFLLFLLLIDMRNSGLNLRERERQRESRRTGLPQAL